MDTTGLDNLLKEFPAPQARILVFPHHGGLPGRGDPYEFALKLCQAVKPETVIFSIGRGTKDTPRPEIIRGIRTATPHAHIACTQLSKSCADTLPSMEPLHLNNLPSRGRTSNSCCAGTIKLELDNLLLAYTPSLLKHRDFIEKEAANALCIKA